MSNNPYGYPPGYGSPAMMGRDGASAPGYSPEVIPYQQRQARVAMPSAQDLAGQNPHVPPFVRAPFYPTAPFYSTKPNVGYQVRYYSTSLNSNTDTDYVVNTEAIRRIQFDIPCRLIAVNGSSIKRNAVNTINALAAGTDARDYFLLRLEYTNGDQLTTRATLGSTVCGTCDNPGEIGGTGWTINPGASFVVGITPLDPNMTIDIVFVCLEMRGPSNYTRG